MSIRQAHGLPNKPVLVRATQLTLLIMLSVSLAATSALAQVDPRFNGLAGDLIVSGGKTVDLSLAITAPWDSLVSPADAVNGIYDPDKWAVVFQYSSVDIQSGTVSFTNHPSGAPVVWLVQGDVTISGVVNLNGGQGTGTAYVPSTPGPGGFRGGKASQGVGSNAGGGFGPGGGIPANDPAGAGRFFYSNPRLVPLIGGSGGGGRTGVTPGNIAGGAGAGAILIASSGTINMIGSIQANGGHPSPGTNSRGGPGSGGSIRLLANAVDGGGTITADPGQGTSSNQTNVFADNGRIRIEANSISSALIISGRQSAVPLTAGPFVIWPEDLPTTALPSALGPPDLRITTVDGKLAPSDPAAEFSDFGDVFTSSPDSITVTLEAANMPTTWSVFVYVIPRAGTPTYFGPAQFVSGNEQSSTWTLNIMPLPDDFSALIARATP